MAQPPIQPVPKMEISVDSAKIISDDVVEITSSELVSEVKSLQENDDKGLKVTISITWTKPK